MIWLFKERRQRSQGDGDEQEEEEDTEHEKHLSSIWWHVKREGSINVLTKH